MSIKVQIMFRCGGCGGKAYLPAGEAEDYKGEKYTTYLPCPVCQGSGQDTKWISLKDFVQLLGDAAEVDPLDTDWSALAQVDPVSQYQDSRESAGI